MMMRLLCIVLVAASVSACGSPTAVPIATTAPTAVPIATTAPTAVPTATTVPTAVPTATTAPTAVPTATTAPTAVPTATTAPTAVPTKAPAPTNAPAGRGTRTFAIVSAQTVASYAVQETFLQQNMPNRAIGKTSSVSGELSFNLDGVPTGEIKKITVDISTLTSDQQQRDDHIREQWLESSKYPIAEFSSTKMIGGPQSYKEGDEITFQMVGNMTIHTVTKPVTFTIKGKLVGDTITGTATANILMSTFGIEPPNVFGFVSVQDDVIITLEFTAKEAK